MRLTGQHYTQPQRQCCWLCQRDLVLMAVVSASCWALLSSSDCFILIVYFMSSLFYKHINDDDMVRWLHQGCKPAAHENLHLCNNWILQFCFWKILKTGETKLSMDWPLTTHPSHVKFKIETFSRPWETCLRKNWIVGIFCSKNQKSKKEIDMDRLPTTYTSRVNWWTLTRLSLIHIWRCRRSTLCRSRWSPYH